MTVQQLSRRRPGATRRARAVGSCVAVVTLLLAGCSATVPAAGADGVVALPLPSRSCGGDVAAALAAAAAAVRARDRKVAVGIVLIDRAAAGCRSTDNGSETFPTASVVKLLIAIDALTTGDVDRQGVATLERMLARSDDSIASTLWSQHGGSAIIDRTRTLIGLPSLEAPTSTGEWGSTRIDSSDVARIWLWLLQDAPDEVRTTVLQGTGGAREIAADGFDQYFGIPDALQSSTWWIKQGWGSSRGRRIVNTTGVIGSDQRFVLVVLTSHPMAVSFTVATGAATAAVRALAGVVGRS